MHNRAPNRSDFEPVEKPVGCEAVTSVLVTLGARGYSLIHTVKVNAMCGLVTFPTLEEHLLDGPRTEAITDMSRFITQACKSCPNRPNELNTESKSD